LIRYRQATEAIKRSHYQIIWLLATGKKPQEVAQVTGYTRIWIYQLVKRYNQFGTSALGDDALIDTESANRRIVP
jgi:transposase